MLRRVRRRRAREIAITIATSVGVAWASSVASRASAQEVGTPARDPAAPPAVALRPARVRLDADRARCVDPAALARLVDRVVGREVITESDPIDYAIALDVEDPPRRARIVLRDANGGEIGARTLESAGACGELLRPLAFVIGMLLDLHERDATLHVPSDLLPLPPAGGGGGEGRGEERASVPDGARARLGLAIGGEVLTGWGPGELWAIALSGALSVDAFLLRLDVEVAPYAEIDGQRGSADLSSIGARLGVGGRIELGSAAIELLVELSSAALRARGRGFSENVERWGAVVALGARAGITVELGGPFFLGIDLAADGRLLGQSMRAVRADGSEVEVFSTAPFASTAGIRAGAWIDL
jgi:hypothetical protein